MSSIRTDDEIDKLLNHDRNTLRVRVKTIGSGNHGNGGRKSGTETNRDKDDHADAAVLAEVLGNKVASELTGFSPSALSKFVRGKNSNNDPDPVLEKKLDTRLGKVSEKVVDKVDVLLDLFSQSKMEDLEAKEIPSSIEKMVNVVDKLNRRNDKISESGPRVQVTLYAPKQINISEYTSLEV